jgi:putative DNA methylase
VTDPPFYDNVHYSELADFFHVWQRLWLGDDVGRTQDTTRDPREVQDTDSDRFSDKLTAVFAECHRVLKDEGLLVFSYHHSREDGWSSVAAAVLNAGLRLVQAQPVKAEMSVAMPKLAAKSPIDLDVLMVCRKAADDRRPMVAAEAALEGAEAAAEAKVERFNKTGRWLSLNDVRIVVFSQALVEFCAGRTPGDALQVFGSSLEDCAAAAQRLHRRQDDRPRAPTPIAAETPVQASLF